jgi:integrase
LAYGLWCRLGVRLFDRLRLLWCSTRYVPETPSAADDAAGLRVSSGARFCELISFVPVDFDFGTGMLTVSKSTVEVTAKYHPEGHRFLTRHYTKNGEHRRFKIDSAVTRMVQGHIALHGIGPGELIFPVRLFASTEAAARERLTQEEI